ncbi:MAG TPA: adenylate/guanylate cyclase domain-containing protein [Spirochaetales bacterium]|nr:adenylate/guanylate cyclase domain-containing protein [Spirochaetales bacterium]HPM71586.1 adenylate/guanylate cyclase domain-containing protein [Spirochaetales bacterium]
MNARRGPNDALRFLPGWAWTALVASWLIAPLAASRPSAFSTGATLAAAGAGGYAMAAGIAAWLLVAIALWEIVAYFVRGRLPMVADPASPIAAAVHVVSSASAALIQAASAMSLATRPDYFSSIPWWDWAMAAAALAWNAYSIARLIRSLSEKDAGYREYSAFRSSTEKPGSLRSKLGRARGIQGRLTVLFTGLILLIIVVLATSLLRDFGSTLLSAIMDNGRSLADRGASIVKTNISDKIAVDDYLAIEAAKNEGAAFPFSSVTYYRRDPKSGSYAARASTDPAIVGQAPSSVPEAGAAEAMIEAMIEAPGTIEFRAPVTLSGVNLGFVSVVYDRQTIYGPYYLTTVKTAIISFLFLYASIFVTYLFGRGIVFPILFLRMSVNAIATRLASMVKGSERVSADSLRYDDRVATKDEIKKLSLEIGNMAAVIRGVVPYISASTLRHSEREKPTTERRELAFLFTDIRGFTTICEGRSPEEVVAMLNHYLDIQTEAIVANGGDIDKFVGDEVMAVFDGPEKELQACRAGMAIRKAMAEAQEQARKESGAVVSIGIGINAGPVVFGSVGARERMDFTSIGDTVNLAARLEGANKTYGTKSLVAEAVYDRVKDDFLCREVDLLAVKGKNVPVRIYEVLQERDKASQKLIHIKEGFEAGLAAYRSKRWSAAKKIFAKVSEAYGDEASEVFLRRVEVFEAAPPPADWDGVFRMTVK